MPKVSIDPHMRRIIGLLLAAIFLFGVAVAAMQPPFEGFDETAHFSRVQSLAFAKQTVKASRYLSTDVYDYYRRGPMPYEWIAYERLHADDPLRGYTTYHDFFAQPSRVADYSRKYADMPLPAGFNPDPEANWQYQHPPLYYLLAAPVMKTLAGHASLITGMLVLRLFSFVLAFAGLLIGFRATRNYLAEIGAADAGVIMALGLVYPFLMPEFFWEFARIGNDSLCLFLFGIVWALLLWHMRAPRSDAWIYLGFFMGLSWWSKALMIPVCAGILGFLALYHIFTVRKMPESSRSWWFAPLQIAGLILALGAPYYAINFIHSGSFGAQDFKQGIETLHGDTTSWLNFPWLAALDGVREMFYSAVWLAGSWSALVFERVVQQSLAVFAIIVLFAYGLNAWQRRDPLFRLPLWTLGPLFAGLAAHIALTIMIKAQNFTPGYYFHILAPSLVLVYGLGLQGLVGKKWLKLLMIFLCLSIILTGFYVAWSYMTAFSGCAILIPTTGGFILPHAEVLRCTAQPGMVMNQLAVLAWPKVALACLGIAFVLLATAGVSALKGPKSGRLSLNRP